MGRPYRAPAGGCGQRHPLCGEPAGGCQSERDLGATDGAGDLGLRPTALGIIGLGAIGGSIARRAAAHGVRRVVGYARDRRDAVQAARAGAVTEVVHSVRQAMDGVDLLVLAAPPSANLELLEALAPSIRERDLLCTDVTSVKQPIVALAERLSLESAFAGSHPLAGTHETGFTAASADLFEGAVVYVSRLRNGESPEAEIADFWERVMGAHAVRIPAERHDHLLAWTSHLPQAIASALAATLDAEGLEGATYGSGARSTTRLAVSDSKMWTDILLQNREQVGEALRGFGRSVDDLMAALNAGDGKALSRWLERAARWRSRMDP